MPACPVERLDPYSLSESAHMTWDRTPNATAAEDRDDRSSQGRIVSQGLNGGYFLHHDWLLKVRIGIRAVL